MNRGQKAGKKMDSTTFDISAILNLMINCKNFSVACGVKKNRYAEAAKNVRGAFYRNV